MIVYTSERVAHHKCMLFPSLANNVAAITGKTAFFAPSTLTVPFNLISATDDDFFQGIPLRVTNYISYI